MDMVTDTTPRCLEDVKTEKQAHEWFWEVARNLSLSTIEAIQKRVLCHSDSAVEEGACRAWERYLSFTGGAFVDADGNLYHRV
jgi:hypothetical protein